ncbi:MAG: tRNA uracil 4-sulfurtransferase ThiI [Acidobacteriota bacterium]
MTDRIFVLHYAGELSVKAKGTRNRFSERLARNLADALESAGVPFQIRRTWARLYVESPSSRAAEVAARVFGVSAVTVAAKRSWQNLEEILQAGEEIFASAVAGKTFAVRARRGGRRQTMPFNSPEVERELGARLLPGAAGVDLKTPEVEVRVELRRAQAYYSSHRIEGASGLPLGTEGRALALISGGFDSMVAAWLLLRRGVRLDYLFCNLSGEAHRDAVLRVMKVLADDWSYGYRPRLHLVDFKPVVAELKAQCPQPLWQVVLKRQMLRTADRLARLLKVSGIVTGEAVGQVSSQTLQNLAVISSVTEIPILRPLIGSQKDEIIALARRIGTHDLSAEVQEQCMLVPRHPETHAKPQKVLDAEVGLAPQTLERLIEERAVFDLRVLNLDKTKAPGLEVERIPEGAVVIDLRSPVAYKAWHPPGALHLDYREALESYRSLEADKTYVFYCEVGLKSAHLAELMHQAGFRAHHFGGGLKALLRQVEQQDEALRAVMSPVLLD